MFKKKKKKKSDQKIFVLFFESSTTTTFNKWRSSQSQCESSLFDAKHEAALIRAEKKNM